ncbi:MAG: hypothetical protein KDA24_26805 [Deltaproteobacteria bacterium]|nr:hypothetical protein [Deltaproteobacteria bacterium]
MRFLSLLLAAPLLAAGCAGPPSLNATLRLFADGEVQSSHTIDCSVERATIVRYLEPGDLTPLADTEEPWLETVVDTDQCLGYPDELLRMELFAEARRYGTPRLLLRVPEEAGEADLAEDVEVVVQSGEVLAMGREAGTSFSMRVQEARSVDAYLGDCACESVQILDASWTGAIDNAVDRDAR